MAELKSGSLVKFLSEMDVDGNTLLDNEPVLLQIRSIIPVLREGDSLWPNQGFFLKVSDLSHALYVSLPQDQDDMVLCNRLHIGQLMYVDKLEAAYPVPLLRGIRPVPGRHSCDGNPKDLLPIHILDKCLGVSNSDCRNFNLVGTKLIGNSRSLSPSKLRLYEQKRTSGLSNLNSGFAKRTLNSYRNDVQGSLSCRPKKSDHEFSDKESLIGDHKIPKKKPLQKSTSLGASQAEPDTILDYRIRSSGATDSNNLIKAESVLKYQALSSSGVSTFNYTPKRNSVESSATWQGNSSKRVDKDSDTESSVSSASTLSANKYKYNRRSWNGSETIRLGEISGSPVMRNESMSGFPTPGIPISPARSFKYDSSDENSSSKAERKFIVRTKKTSKIYSKNFRKSVNDRMNKDSVNQKAICSPTFDRNTMETKIFWDLLPPTLVKLGQEVVRQRDVAMVAAVESLQEASAAERLLKCLSAYSELNSVKEADPHLSVDKFFRFQDDLIQTGLVIQSLTSISPLKEVDLVPGSFYSVKDAIKLALDRKENSLSWIKAALEYDLNPACGPIKTCSTLTADNTKRSTKTGVGNKPKGAVIVKKQHKENGEPSVGPIPDKEKQAEWHKGIALPVSTELANSLQDQCRSWFLANAEKYLDWIRKESDSRQPENRVAENMCQIKRVSDWLDNRCKENTTLETSEIEACSRVRNKIYGILLKHVERTTLTAMVDS